MKKFSMNLLKVGLFLILGLCVFSVGNEVKAGHKLLRTYYAYKGQEITVAIKKDENKMATGLILHENISTFGYATDYNAEIIEHNVNQDTMKIKIPKNVQFDKSYYYISHSGIINYDYSEIYIMPKYILKVAGQDTVNLKVGETAQLSVYKENSASAISINSLTTSKEEKNNWTRESKNVFSSSNSNVAAVDNNGKITAKGAGNATITMTRTITHKRYVDENWHTAVSKLTATIKVTVDEKEDVIESMEIKTKPSKITYNVGEQLNINGINVVGIYSDGSKHTLKNEKLNFSPTKLNKAGKQVITVTLKDTNITTKFDVTVKQTTNDGKTENKPTGSQTSNGANLNGISEGAVLKFTGGSWNLYNEKKLASNGGKVAKILKTNEYVKV